MSYNSTYLQIEDYDSLEAIAGSFATSIASVNHFFWIVSAIPDLLTEASAEAMLLLSELFESFTPMQ